MEAHVIYLVSVGSCMFYLYVAVVICHY